MPGRGGEGRVGRGGRLPPPGAAHSPSARRKSACCFVSFPNSFPTPRKVRGALAGVSSKERPRKGSRELGAVPLGPARSAQASTRGLGG